MNLPVVGASSLGLLMTRLNGTDRTSELRAKGFIGRRLGPVQMTTDTAVRVTRLVIEQKGYCDTLKF